jgi:hypothetical protein
VQQTLELLDHKLGMRPQSVASTLSPCAQEELLALYETIFTGKRAQWPRDFFEHDNLRTQRLRVLLPYAIKEKIGVSVQEVTTPDITDCHFNHIRRKHYRGSSYDFLASAYPWLRPWECAVRPTDIWTGKNGPRYQREAIRHLIEEELELSLASVPTRITKQDFQNHNLGGLLQSFDECVPRAVMFAYPRRYKRNDFLTSPVRVKHPPGSTPCVYTSLLSETEQARTLQIYCQVLSGELKKFPRGYFQDPILRRERLRIIVPYAVDKVIQRPVDQVKGKDLDGARLHALRLRHFRGSTSRLLAESYQWIPPKN